MNLVGTLQGTNFAGVLPVRSKSKSDSIEEQSIDSGETSLFGNVLSLAGVPQDINFIRVLPARNESKSDPAEE